MAYSDLGEFIAVLEEKRLLRRIKAEVDADLEITEIYDRVVKKGGPALLFENVKGYGIPLAINLFGTMERMAVALGVQSVDEIAARIEDLLSPPEISGLLDKIGQIPRLAQLQNIFPTRVKNAPCQEIVIKEPPFLSRFPVQKSWPLDGGPFITLPLVFTRDGAGKQNVGIYRMQVYDDSSTGMHWHRHKHGAAMYAEYEAAGREMPCTVTLGGDPALIYAASAPLPAGIDEMYFAGFLRREPVRLVKSQTNEIWIPANSEIVMEGIVRPGERREEGPFGDHTGYYSAADEYPVFHVKCMTMRKNAIYPSTVVGKPPMEDCFLGKATERIFLPLLKMTVPEIRDINLPLEGVFHNCALVSIRKAYPGQARKVMHALWGLGQMMFTKMIVVLEDDVDLSDYSYVAWRVFNNVDPARDVEIVKGPVDALDHASPYPLFGSKMGIDATRKLPGEGVVRPFPPEIAMSGEIKEYVDKRWNEYRIDE